MAKHSNKNQAGFTILELMVATAIFAVVILVVAVGILRFSQDYFKGVTSSNTDAVARAITNDVAQSLQLSKSFAPSPSNGNTKGYCVDNTLYRYNLGSEVGKPASSGPYQHGLVKESISGGCPSSIQKLGANLKSGQREMLNEHMRLAVFDITPAGGSGGTVNIHIRVVYGDDDLLCSPSKNDCSKKTTSTNLNQPDLSCKSTVGSQFCAVADLVTSVQQRLQGP